MIDISPYQQVQVKISEEIRDIFSEYSDGLSDDVLRKKLHAWHTKASRVKHLSNRGHQKRKWGESERIWATHLVSRLKHLIDTKQKHYYWCGY